MGQKMLELINVSAGYNGTDVVKNVSLAVNAGENLSIIGPNGCGKTTLLKAVANILPYRGEIALDGKPTRKLKQREISRKIAMLSQNSGAYFSYTVYDTVMMGRYLHIKDRLLGLPSSGDKDFVLECLKTADLLDVKDREITRLSGGQLQRVFLAQVLAQDPAVILLDEPTNHLDLKFQIELVEYLKQWASQWGRAVVGVMHDINLALRLSARLLVMKGGGVSAYGNADEIMTGGLLENTYGIDVAGYMRELLAVWENVK
ncbi:MAG: ABC transporter ATP-binding protein [Oscillospiraceae bacterium]|nr:ABC transporter ATP-binding protein [Oscillospiraceae bacterium]